MGEFLDHTVNDMAVMAAIQMYTKKDSPERKYVTDTLRFLFHEWQGLHDIKEVNIDPRTQEVLILRGKGIQHLMNAERQGFIATLRGRFGADADERVNVQEVFAIIHFKDSMIDPYMNLRVKFIIMEANGKHAHVFACRYAYPFNRNRFAFTQMALHQGHTQMEHVKII
ncbi:MAG: hypothetical protein ABIH41_07075 [Nanoarchaeota archaeon]